MTNKDAGLIEQATQIEAVDGRRAGRARPEMKKAPLILVALRLLCGPLIIVSERLGAPGTALMGIVGVAFVSDVFDGVIARRVGAETEALRRADSIVDALFYLAASTALMLRSPDVLWRNAAGVSVLIGLEISRLVVERAKFGRMAAYHMWSAKAWGIALFLGFSEAFLTQQPGPLFFVAVALGILTDLEGLATSLILSTWRHDVPSLWHAVRLERLRRS